MRFSARLQLLTCLVLYASSAHAIMVKFGTKDGPIEPPTPEPSPSPQPYRDPAPVWEERANDTPDPNAQWRPPFFVPQRYTKVIYNPPSIPTPAPLNNAQRFVSAYIPANPVKQLNPGNNILGSQSLPGIGLRYFFPAYSSDQQRNVRQEDAKLNQLEADFTSATEASSDFQWQYEKESTRRNVRNNQETTAGVRSYPTYQWPVYVPPQHH
ncbi:GV1 [Anticarsia gemmatalis]|uniref:GV1 n=1 Tax=Anticarsia gemmatalis TaxID=129554 RepID=UPI003F76ADFD